MRADQILFLLAAFIAGCTSTEGTPVDQSTLGYLACADYFDCGAGRYCTESGTCFTDCRTTADCALFGENMICNRFGQCLEAEGRNRCSSHADCGPNRYCNGICSASGAGCGAPEDCPYDYDECAGKCAAPCGQDDDCKETCVDERCTVTNDRCEPDADCVRLREQECTPVGQCMQPGWEKWIPPGKLPPTHCTRDSQCKVLGWRYVCDCDKEIHRGGIEVCAGGNHADCVEGNLDLGDGPASSPAHGFVGVWGMRMEIGSVTVGVPLVNKQNTYSTNLFLVKMSHEEGDIIKIDQKACEIQLINFNDDDQPFSDLAWMIIPHLYIRALPIIEQTAEVTSAVPGSAFETSQSCETRGLVLDDPVKDDLPTRDDFLANPNDHRFWDQDEDGNAGMTTMMNGILRGAIYNVQRWKAVYHGEILDADHIRGLSSIENQQNVISASTPALIHKTTTEIHADPTRTFHRFLRMSDDTSCADLIRAGHREDSWLRHTNHMMDVPDP
jgi:hypothetical protein